MAGDTPDAPLLAFYRSEHVNQNWLATLMVIVDVAAFIKAANGSWWREVTAKLVSSCS